MENKNYSTVFEADLAYLRSLGDTSECATEFEVRLKTLRKLGGDIQSTTPLLFEIEKKILDFLGGDSSLYDNIYFLRKAIAEKQGVNTEGLHTIYAIAVASLNSEPVDVKYTITFKNYDGTILETQSLSLNEMPVYEGSTPVRESDGEYNYTFNGWLPEISPVSGNAEYVAQYTATEIEYTVTFKNYDGTILSTQKVLSGEIPVYEGSTPVRESDGEYNYTFNGWLPELGPVTGNVEYVAQYTATEIPVGPDLTLPYVTFTAEEANSTIGLEKLSTYQTLEYSTDTTNWNTMNTTTNISLPNVGDKVYVRGILSGDNSGSNYTRFKMTGKIAASGNCNAIWNYQDLEAPLKKYCGCNMFWGCTSLTSAPELPATELAEKCYYYIFEDCSSLVTAPELPATTLADYCYNGMFSKCTSLVTAPSILPATTLVSYCYDSMFEVCTSLTTAPELPATKLIRYCYQNMFKGCSKLNKITCLATNNTDGYYNCTSYWVSGVSSTGTFIKNPDMNNWSTGASGIPSGWTVVDNGVTYYTIDFVEDGKLLETKRVKEGEIPVYTGAIPVKSYNEDFYYELSGWYPEITAATSDFTYSAQLSLKELEPISGSYVTFTSEEANSTIGLEKLSTNQTLEYRTNDIGWVELNKATNISVNVDDKVYIRGILSDDNSDSNYTRFKMTGKIAASGNCNAIWNYQDLEAPLKWYCGYRMFNGCTALTTAPELPANDLTLWCYQFMFSGCTSLTTAPELPATTLVSYCYDGMFGNCTALTTAPELPATTLASYCYMDMFNGCTSLTTAPELPATTLADNCYDSMFKGCTSLTTSPELTATTLVVYCYDSMFKGCTSLTTAPELPATTLINHCYSNMFEGCTSLVEAPELLATTMVGYCYHYMFSGCTKLNKITCLATNSSDSFTYAWLLGVSTTGTFIKNPDMNDWETGASGIPSGWTVEDYVG